MRRFILGAAVAAVALSTAFAQSPPAKPVDPVLAAYRDYRVALEKKDGPAAEEAAARALAASEARDGDGGSTAALALNLASLRLSAGRPREAIAPARRAVELADKGAKGVDPLMARLVLGEAELSEPLPKGDPSLVETLAQAEKRGHDVDEFAYPAAVALGKAAQEAERWQLARTAWRFAASHVPRDDASRDSKRASALLGLGIALMSVHEDKEADQVLGLGMDLMRPLAVESLDADKISGAELLFAQLLAVRSAVGARTASEGMGKVPRIEGQIHRTELAPLCQNMRWSPSPMPVFPQKAMEGMSVGAVVMRMSTDKDGNVLSAHVLAAVPGAGFLESVSNPRIKWTLKAQGKQEPGCRLNSADWLVVVRFTLG